MGGFLYIEFKWNTALICLENIPKWSRTYELYMCEVSVIVWRSMSKMLSVRLKIQYNQEHWSMKSLNYETNELTLWISMKSDYLKYLLLYQRKYELLNNKAWIHLLMKKLLVSRDDRLRLLFISERPWLSYWKKIKWVMKEGYIDKLTIKKISQDTFRLKDRW